MEVSIVEAFEVKNGEKHGSNTCLRIRCIGGRKVHPDPALLDTKWFCISFA